MIPASRNAILFHSPSIGGTSRSKPKRPSRCWLPGPCALAFKLAKSICFQEPARRVSSYEPNHNYNASSSTLG
jgi:hypothetical protein